jgi:hypothetical protein
MPAKIVALHGNHGCVFLLASFAAKDDAVRDRQVFESTRKTFRSNG